MRATLEGYRVELMSLLDGGKFLLIYKILLYKSHGMKIYYFITTIFMNVVLWYLNSTRSSKFLGANFRVLLNVNGLGILPNPFCMGKHK